MADDLVFVCYSRKDQDFAIELATILKNRGVPIWLDQWNIPSGANWNRSIENALKKSTHLLLILSPSSVESYEVESEWNHAIDEKRTIVPILYKPCDIPFRLELIQYIDLTSRSPGDRESIEQLLSALGVAKNTDEKAVEQQEQLQDDSQKSSSLGSVKTEIKSNGLKEKINDYGKNKMKYSIIAIFVAVIVLGLFLHFNPFGSSPASSIQIPSTQNASIDISENIGEIRNQGDQGSAVGFAVAYAMQAAIKAKTGETVILSPQSIYNEARQYDGTPAGKDNGTYLNSALKAMEKIGAYLESDWPYSSQTPNPGTLPSYRISSYSEISGIDGIINAMKQGKVVVIGIEVPTSFASPNSKNRGEIVVENPKKIIGMHALCLVGYDQNNSMFKFANSWGREWGEDGFGTISDTDLSQILLNAYAIEP